MGKREATSAVAGMHPTFRNMRLSLVVGVCAVAPYVENGSEILLGDVVISTCVIQPDLGRQYEGAVIRKDTLEGNLARPPQEIQRLLRRLELEYHHEQLTNRMRGYMEDLQSRSQIYTYPGTELDQLYAADYIHMHRATELCTECKDVKGAPAHVCAKAKLTCCADLGCETSQLLPRRRLSKPTGSDCQTSIWFGRFASGDQVLKSASHRERLHKDDRVIAFEMEGSGAWEHFPTVIIKSGCDYADSHKSKTWQKYCAGTAAACAKAFLQEWRRKQNVKEGAGVQSLPNRMQSLAGEVHRPFVPPLRSSNPLFVGRAAELARIEQQFSPTDPSEHKIAGRPNIVVIQGLGGSGKSELCLRYLKIHQPSYWAIFWIDGSTDTSITFGFKCIASQLGLPSDDVTTVGHHLASQDQLWLLIIDNADDPKLDLTPYLPDQGIGHILITTRNPELSIFETESPFRLEGLAEHDALALLFKVAGISAQDQASLKHGAEEIMKRLDFHTLAIVQAGAYVRKTRDLSGYVRIFDEQKRRILEYCAPQARAQYGSVYATFEVSALKLGKEADEQQQQAAADALELLRLFAFMDSKGPFERIFSDARDFAISCTNSVKSTTKMNDVMEVDDVVGLAQRHCSMLTPLAYATNDSAGRHRWREACDKLCQYSMLSFGKDENGDEILTIHPLIQAWALARQSENGYRESWLSVAAVIFFSSRGLKEYSPLLQRLGTHACNSAGHISKDWWTKKSNLPFLFLLYQLGWMLSLRRDDTATSAICQCLEAGIVTARKHLWRSSSGRLSIQYLLGQHARDIGELNKSIELMEHVVRVQKRKLPKTHHNLLTSQHVLATVYHENWQFQKAVQLIEHVVQLRDRTLPKTHASQLASQQVLAIAYQSNGQTQRAVQLMEHVVKVQKQILPETHPNLLTSQHMLAVVYHANGQIQRAIQLLKHVVKIREQTLPETHPSRLTSQHALATAYFSYRQVPEALHVIEYVVQARKKTLPKTHQDRLASQHLLAMAYHANGQLQMAIQLLEYVVKTQEQIPPETHPNRLASQHELAKAYFSYRQFPEALHVIEYVVQVRKKTLSETHQNRLASQHLLAVVYHANGQLQMAIQLLEYIVKIREQTLPPAHPDRLAAQLELGWAYHSDGQIPEALRLIEYVVQVRKQTLPGTHPDRLISEYFLSQYLGTDSSGDATSSA